MSIFEGVDRGRSSNRSKFSPSSWRPEVGDWVILTKVDSTGVRHIYTEKILNNDCLDKLTNDTSVVKIERNMPLFGESIW